MNVRRPDDSAAFLEQAGPLLLADGARHNLILGVASTLVSAPDYKNLQTSKPGV